MATSMFGPDRATAAHALQDVSAATPDDVLTYWFGANHREHCNTTAYLQEVWPIWFMGRSLSFDLAQRGCRELIHRAGSGDLDGELWCTPSGTLAKILLLDQFTRCAFRGTADAFQYDSIGIGLAKRCAEDGTYDGYFLPAERFIITVALSHAEDKSLNELHVTLAKRVAAGAPPETVDYFSSMPGYPDQHWDVVRRFGRFPGRNAALGRESTAEEVTWLASPECPGWAKSQSKAILSYWPMRGLGDLVRWMLEFTMIPYEEVRISSREQLLALKASGKLAFGQVPLLEIDGVELVQTLAILRYLARKKHIQGATSAEEAKADMAANAILECRGPLQSGRFQGPPPAEVFASYLHGIFTKTITFLEKMLAKSGPNGYLAGPSLTYADVMLLDLVCYTRDESGSEATNTVLAKAPFVKSVTERLAATVTARDFLKADRRLAPPDDAMVRQVCSIMDMAPPAYLSKV